MPRSLLSIYLEYQCTAISLEINFLVRLCAFVYAGIRTGCMKAFFHWSMASSSLRAVVKHSWKHISTAVGSQEIALTTLCFSVLNCRLDRQKHLLACRWTSVTPAAPGCRTSGWATSISCVGLA